MGNKPSSHGFRRQDFIEDDGSYVQARQIEYGPLYDEKTQVPQLPLPELEHTLQVLLESCRALAQSPSELLALEQIIANMLLADSPARLAQHKLELLRDQASVQHTSWFIQFWNQHAYLKDRSSVAHNVSYHLLLRDDIFANKTSPPLFRAARFVYHALHYRDLVCQGQLAPDRHPTTKLAMDNSQHKFLFHTCRIPGQTQDWCRMYDWQRFPHFTVARNGRFYLVQSAPNATVREIYSQLDWICRDADKKSSGQIGLLTSQTRDEWFADRAKVLRNHSTALLQLESAAFLVCLDGAQPQSRRSVAVHMLNASEEDVGNRFWDKSSQIIVSSNGKIAYVAEHSMCDGVTTARFVNHVLQAMDDEALEEEQSITLTAAKPKEIVFRLSATMQRQCVQAKKDFVTRMALTESDVLQFTQFGSDRIKSEFQLSPDAFAQMAIQSAGRLVFGSYRATYESTQTRTFAQGRTEVTRVLTEDSKKFCDALWGFSPPNKDGNDLKSMLTNACKRHGEYVQKAVRGMGCDRHLLAIKLVGGGGELFTNELYLRAGRWDISTSGLSGSGIDGWSFGEVVEGGVGVAYSVQPQHLRFTVTSSSKLASEFCQALDRSLAAMQEIFNN
ncbi:hypothetical protein BASA81_013260 [Batrachochytrium salamandrivorans]|nr:hypothetical protein BASA81_013260 [Batrachochytrium salamandrivorans]